MQNAPPSKEPKLENNELKKWLPAILLAIILHLIVVIAFLIIQKHNTANTSTKASDNTAQRPANEMLIKDLGNENGNMSTTEAMLTITESTPNLALNLASEKPAIDTLTTKKAGLENQAVGIDRVATGKDTDINILGAALSQQQANVQTPNKDMTDETLKDKQWLADRQLQTNKTLPTAASTKEATGQTNATDRAPLTTSTNTVNNMVTNRQTITRNPNHNLNEGLLLSRDSPKSIAIDSGAGSDARGKYDIASQETEAINDKLSQTINAVKELKMRQIQQDALREQTAHAQDQANNLRAQVAQVGQQLNVDKLAEKEFATINANTIPNSPDILSSPDIPNSSDASNTSNKPLNIDKQHLASP